MQHNHPLPLATPPVPESKDLTDADLEAVVAGKELKELGRGGMEGRSGWFVPLPAKLRR